MRLRGKTILLSGASSGIGRAAAELFAREGAAVALLARREALLEEVVRGIEAAGGRALALPGDITDEAFVAQAAARAAEWGGGLDAVLANAALGLVGEVEHFAYADWCRMLEVNLGGTFLLVRAAIPHLRARGGGHVLAVGSELSRGAMPGLAGYVASKWGLLGFMRALSMELHRHNIRVCSVLPGGTLTDFGPDDAADKRARRERGERFLEPASVAEALLFALQQPPEARVTELDIMPM
ncbi:SDR family oxidoreductase [Roseomonas sp. BN140053]|uniref:SDR family oxidoreductase n=1 Tax=Roseomonas sp. BN140053 TaxID=3391898 RepID=UPI0039EC6662